jgi:hypothetical protein
LKGLKSFLFLVSGFMFEGFEGFEEFLVSFDIQYSMFNIRYSFFLFLVSGFSFEPQDIVAFI